MVVDWPCSPTVLKRNPEDHGGYHDRPGHRDWKYCQGEDGEDPQCWAPCTLLLHMRTIIPCMPPVVAISRNICSQRSHVIFLQYNSFVPWSVFVDAAVCSLGLCLWDFYFCYTVFIVLISLPAGSFTDYSRLRMHYPFFAQLSLFYSACSRQILHLSCIGLDAVVTRCLYNCDIQWNMTGKPPILWIPHTESNSALVGNGTFFFLSTWKSWRN